MKQKINQLCNLAFMLCVLQACNGQQSKTKTTATTSTEKKATATTTAKGSGKFSTGNASFKINGVQAFRAFDRQDKPIAQLNAVNDNLTISMHGDIKDGVMQGMLNIRKIPFNKTAGSITNASVTYIRYLDERGGKSVSYTNRNVTFNLTKCERKTNGAVGEEWLLTGTFSGTLKVASYDEPIAIENGVDREINITDCKFEDLTMVVLGKKM